MVVDFRNLLTEIQQELKLNEIDPDKPLWWGRAPDTKDKVKRLIEALHHFHTWERNHPELHEIIAETEGLENLLRSFLKAYQGDRQLVDWLSKLPSDEARQIDDRIDKLIRWIEEIKFEHKQKHPPKESPAKTPTGNYYENGLAVLKDMLKHVCSDYGVKVGLAAIHEYLESTKTNGFENKDGLRNIDLINQGDLIAYCNLWNPIMEKLFWKIPMTILDHFVGLNDKFKHSIKLDDLDKEITKFIEPFIRAHKSLANLELIPINISSAVDGRTIFHPTRFYIDQGDGEKKYIQVRKSNDYVFVGLVPPPLGFWSKKINDKVGIRFRAIVISL
jgi:hypothetical protein